MTVAPLLARGKHAGETGVSLAPLVTCQKPGGDKPSDMSPLTDINADIHRFIGTGLGLGRRGGSHDLPRRQPPSHPRERVTRHCSGRPGEHEVLLQSSTLSKNEHVTWSQTRTSLATHVSHHSMIVRREEGYPWARRSQIHTRSLH